MTKVIVITTNGMILNELEISDVSATTNQDEFSGGLEYKLFLYAVSLLEATLQ
jgi:hypothetical protein